MGSLEKVSPNMLGTVISHGRSGVLRAARPVESAQGIVVAPEQGVRGGIRMILHLSGRMTDSGKPAGMRNSRRALAEGAGGGPSVSPGGGCA